jgi:WD40-like Beta Propeller Repeat/RTX calcium-binding nonapeptide repeat (4 copies)
LLALVAASLGVAGPAPAQAGCNANQAWQDRFPAWSPTGGAIAFMRQQVGCDPPPESLGILQSGRPEEIIGADGLRGSWASPSWSPNGLAVALGSFRNSVAVDAPGGVVGDDGPGAFPSWAGTSIAVTVGSSLQVIELITGTRRTLVPSYAKPTQSNGVASWSPDRTRLAFGVMVNSTEGGIGVVNADGSGFRVIARGPNQSVNPTWSPDGQRLAFETNRSGDFEIYSVRADGTDVRNLSRSAIGDDRMPAWHGDTIAFISNRDRSPRDLYGFALYTMSSDGSNQRWRAADLHPYSGLSWSPDGSQLAFASGRECFRWGIYVIDLQTESVRRVTNQCTFNGGARDDTLSGTPFKDFLDGFGGNDRLYGLAGADILRGDYGNDSLYGGPGPDLLLGGGGRNTVRGGDGNDRIQSDPRGHDRIFGGNGNDLVESASGSRDVVSCGPGRDTVVADKVDRVGRDCEHVRRI